MGRERVELLGAQHAESYSRLRHRIEGLAEAEYWWEPVPGCWTLRRQDDGRLLEDYEDVDPIPAPFTTIAWRLFHIACCKVMYHEYAFGSGELTWQTIERPESIAAMIDMLEHGQQLLSDDLAGLADDAALDLPVQTNWGDSWPAWRVFWSMIHHDAHHGAEIGTMRDLWFHTTRVH